MSQLRKLGVLYVVATPIGNLEDLPARAERVLRSVNLIAAEDTRRVAKLLSAIGVSRALTSFHSYSSPRKLSEIMARLAEGEDVALVTDAGTPCISDPGAELVAAALGLGVRVVPVPGPCAAVAAISVSGFPAGRFFFAGYPPRKGAERRQLLAQALSAPWPAVFYESARRLPTLLKDIVQMGGQARRVVVARELTKLHEELVHGPASQLAERYSSELPKGEVTVVVEPAGQAIDRRPGVEPRDLALWLRGEGLSPGRVAAALVRFCGLSRTEAYQLALST